MRATKNELPVLLEAGLSTVRGVDWGEMRVGVVSVPAGTDFAPLPDDRCQGPHWGYVLKGRLRVEYAFSEETVSAGDFIYLPPGHSAVAEEDTEFLEVTPVHLHQQFVDNALRNIQIMRARAATTG